MHRYPPGLSDPFSLSLPFRRFMLLYYDSGLAEARYLLHSQSALPFPCFSLSLPLFCWRNKVLFQFMGVFTSM